jgi:hypothetical protein
MSDNPARLSRKLAVIGTFVVSAVIAGCTAEITPIEASIEDGQEQITLRLQVTSSDLAKLMKPGLVVYLGLGDCDDERASIYSQAELNGVSLVNTPRAILKDIPAVVTLIAEFDDRKVLNYRCAFVEGNSMSGRGAISGPVRLHR